MPENKSTFSASDILSQLDNCAKEFSFPMLDNGYIYPIVSRLSAYGNRHSWVIVIEVAGYHYRFYGHSGVENCQYIFGNHLHFPPGMNNDNVLNVTADSEEGPTFIRDLFGTLQPEVNSLLIRGQKVTIPKDPAFYESRQVTLSNPPDIRIYEFLRACLPELKEELLSLEEELFDSFRLDLPRILRLDEWHHPDVAIEEMPSENETFQMIAAVLERGDAALYTPKNNPNTHWSNWPGGGTC